MLSPPAPGTYRFALAEDGMTISFSQGTSEICFDEGRLRGVMGAKFDESSSRVIAYSNAVQAMHRDKVIPDATGMYWGAPQVIRLQEKCTGTPVVDLFPYRTSEKINGSRQYNTIVHCRVQLAVQRVYVQARTTSRVIDLFGIASSQESNDDPPPPPPPRNRKRKRRPAAQDTASKRSPRRSITSEEYEREEEGSAAEGDEHEEYHRGYL